MAPILFPHQNYLTMQAIRLLHNVFEASGPNLDVYPYQYDPVAAMAGTGLVMAFPIDDIRNRERGVDEIIRQANSGELQTTDGGLFEKFQQKFGVVGSPGFEAAQKIFVDSCANYAVTSFLIEPVDRHHRILVLDNVGGLVDIGLGVVAAPGGSEMRYLNAKMKLTEEMLKVINPTGLENSNSWDDFISCARLYLAARGSAMGAIISIVSVMSGSGLPCFRDGDPVAKLREKCNGDLSDREAASFIINVCKERDENAGP